MLTCARSPIPSLGKPGTWTAVGNFGSFGNLWKMQTVFHLESCEKTPKASFQSLGTGWLSLMPLLIVQEEVGTQGTSERVCVVIAQTHSGVVRTSLILLVLGPDSFGESVGGTPGISFSWAISRSL